MLKKLVIVGIVGFVAVAAVKGSKIRIVHPIRVRGPQGAR